MVSDLSVCPSGATSNKTMGHKKVLRYPDVIYVSVASSPRQSRCGTVILHWNPPARVAKLADAKDLKSFSPQGECGFKSRPGHHRIERRAGGREADPSLDSEVAPAHRLARPGAGTAVGEVFGRTCYTGRVFDRPATAWPKSTLPRLSPELSKRRKIV